MCSICGGAVCAGGGCQLAVETTKIVVQNPSPFVQAIYSLLHSYVGVFFTSVYDFGQNSLNLISGESNRLSEVKEL